MPTTVAGGTGIVGHEIKVSRADLMSELANPAKADPWARYCDAWWLVIASPDLIEGLDIPSAWGVMSPPSGRCTRRMTVLKAAPVLSPVSQSSAYQAIARWNLYRGHDRTLQYERRITEQQRKIESLESALLSWKIAERSGSLPEPETAKAIREILKILEERFGFNQWRRADPAEVAAAVADLAGARSEAAIIMSQLKTLEHLVGRMSEPLRLLKMHTKSAGDSATEIAKRADAAIDPSGIPAGTPPMSGLRSSAGLARQGPASVPLGSLPSLDVLAGPDPAHRQLPAVGEVLAGGDEVRALPADAPADG
jgi:hypothetical protein